MLGLHSLRTLSGFKTRTRQPWYGTWDPEALRAIGWTGPQPSSTVIPYVDDWSVMGIPAAWRCANLIAGTIAQLPVYAYTSTPEARVDPTPPVLADPWPLLTYTDWIFGVVWSLLLRGNAYALPTDFDPATGYPRQLVLLNPDDVWVELDEATGLPIYRLGSNRGDVILGPGEILHARGVTPPGSPVGVGVIEAHRRGFSAMMTFDAYASQAFEAGVPSGMIKVDRPELGEEQARDLKDRWLASFSGRREPAVLPRSITFEPISFTPSDMEYVEARKLGATEVCWVFGVHPNLIGAPAGNSMTYQNLEAAAIDFARFSLTPWSARIEQTLSKWIPRSQTARFEYGGLLRGTTMERLQAQEVALRAGILTMNEVRDLEHRPRYGAWADEPFATGPEEVEPKAPDLVVVPTPEEEVSA